MRQRGAPLLGGAPTDQVHCWSGLHQPATEDGALTYRRKTYATLRPRLIKSCRTTFRRPTSASASREI